MADMILHNGMLLTNVHEEDECLLGHCSIHNPSDHPLRDEPLTWWGEGINAMARVCEHGFTHPDPDDIAFKMATGQWIAVEAISSVHLMKENCDGCCVDPK